MPHASLHCSTLSCLRCSPPLPYQGKSAMKSIGNPKTVRRLHNDTSASDRLESLNTIIHSRGTVDRWSIIFFIEQLPPFPSANWNLAHQSTMETSQADVTSVKVRSFQSQIFLSGLRFHQLYAYMTLFSSTSNFLSNDVGCENILIGQ